MQRMTISKDMEVMRTRDEILDFSCFFKYNENKDKYKKLKGIYPI